MEGGDAGYAGASEKGAKSRAINLCNYLLNCEIEKPEGLKSEGDEN
jgi:hypothetical protein